MASIEFRSCRAFHLDERFGEVGGVPYECQPGAAAWTMVAVQRVSGCECDAAHAECACNAEVRGRSPLGVLWRIEPNKGSEGVD